MQQQFRSQFNAAGFYKSDDNFVALHIDDATLLKITSSFVCSSPYMTFYKNVTWLDCAFDIAAGIAAKFSMQLQLLKWLQTCEFDQYSIDLKTHLDNNNQFSDGQTATCHNDDDDNYRIDGSAL